MMHLLVLDLRKNFNVCNSVYCYFTNVSTIDVMRREFMSLNFAFCRMSFKLSLLHGKTYKEKKFSITGSSSSPK